MLPIKDIYVKIQNHGRYFGVPSIFIEFSTDEDCTGTSMDACIELFNKIKQQYSKIRHVVIIGNTALMYRKKLEEFLSKIYDSNFKTTIVTSGEYPIINPLTKNVKIDLYLIDINTFNTSQSYVNNLIDIVMRSNDYQFIFNYSQEILKTIEEYYTKMAVGVETNSDGEYFRRFYFNNHPNRHTLILHNNQNIEEISELCISKGWQMGNF